MINYLWSPIDPDSRYYYSREKLARLAAGLHCAAQLDEVPSGGGLPFCKACTVDLYKRASAELAHWQRVILAGWSMVDPQGVNTQWQ